MRWDGVGGVEWGGAEDAMLRARAIGRVVEVEEIVHSAMLDLEAALEAPGETPGSETPR